MFSRERKNFGDAPPKKKNNEKQEKQTRYVLNY